MHLRTFGGLTLEGARFRRPKPLLLIAYLALEGPRDRRQLSGLFWPGAHRPMTNLRTALSQIRRAVPGALEEEGSKVRALVSCDASLLFAASERRDPRAVVASYSGPFLEGYDLRDCGVELEEWVFATREFLAERVREAHLVLGEAALARGDRARAREHAQSARAAPGAAEADADASLRTYRLLLAVGSPHAASLRRELERWGIEADARAADLRPVPPAGAGHAAPRTSLPLPSPPTSFVGRDPELVDLTRLLTTPDTRLVTITGPGGVGKSRLAIHAAQEEIRSGTFPGGSRFVALDSVAEPGRVADAIADELRVPGASADERLEGVIRVLDGSRTLLILDNFEQVVEAAGIVARLVERTSDVIVLVTSRERLGLPGEQLFVLEGMPVPSEDPSPDEASYQDAVQLFVQRARRASLGFDASGPNLRAVAAICRLCGGLPLAIELAAAWVRALPVADIARELEEGIDLLSGGSGGRERHRSMRATFEGSWARLRPEERAALRRLTVFTGGFTREAAARVADVSIPLLASLLDKSMLRVADPARYDRHPLLFRFMLDEARRHPSERERALAEHASYFRSLAEEAEARHRGQAQVEWLDRLEDEQENLRGALEWSLAGGAVRDGVRLAAALFHFWYYRSRLAEGEAWLDLALERSADEPSCEPYRPRLLSAAGALADERGDDVRAAALFERRLALAEAADDAVGRASALNSLGVIAWGRKRHGEARRYLEHSLELRRAAGEPTAVAVGLNNLGLLALASGDPAAAARRLQESYEISSDAGDEMGATMALGNLGTVALQEGDPDRAAALLVEALRRYRKLGDETAVAGCLEDLAGVASLLARHEDAARWAGAADALRERLGSVPRPEERDRIERQLGRSRAALSKPGFQEARCRGRSRPLEHVLDEVVALAAAPSEPTVPRVADGEG